MKNKYFWPHFQAIYFLLGWLVISCILGAIVTQGTAIPFYFFPLLIFAPIGISLVAIFFTFVKVTDDEIICIKYGIWHCRIKRTDVTEWGTYLKYAGRCAGEVLYITSIPTFDLRQGKIINKKVLRRNSRKFFMLGFDMELIAFLKENYPSKKYFLYEKSRYVGMIDETKPWF